VGHARSIPDVHRPQPSHPLRGNRMHLVARMVQTINEKKLQTVEGATEQQILEFERTCGILPSVLYRMTLVTVRDPRAVRSSALRITAALLPVVRRLACGTFGAILHCVGPHTWLAETVLWPWRWCRERALADPDTRV